MSKLIAALCGLLLAVGLAAPAQAADAPVRVSRATFHAYAQDTLSPCGSGYADPTQNQYVAPKAPASVLADLAAYDGHWSVRYASPNVERGLTGNGLPMVYFFATDADYRYIDVMGHRQQVAHHAREYVAAVPGFRGRSCDVWTLIAYTS